MAADSRISACSAAMSVFTKKASQYLGLSTPHWGTSFHEDATNLRLLQGLRFDLFPSEAVCHPSGPDHVALSAEFIN